jgi:hypothetical protein
MSMSFLSSNPAKNVPADRPMRRGDGRLDFGALGFGVPGTTKVGTMVEFADQFHRTVESMKVTIPVIAADARVSYVPGDFAKCCSSKFSPYSLPARSSSAEATW